MVKELIYVPKFLVPNSPTDTCDVTFCYFYLSLPVQLLTECGHVLLISTYSKRYLTTARNQQLIH